MSGFTSPLQTPAQRLALKPPTLLQRIIWKCLGRCLHSLYAWDHVSGDPGRLCVLAKGHDGQHKSHDGRHW